MNNIPKCTLVPTRFFDEKDPGCFLSEVSILQPGGRTGYVRIPRCDAVLVYEDSGTGTPVLADLLSAVQSCGEYSKILCSYIGGVLSLVIALGRDIQLANVYEAPDFTTAEYFIFSALKSLQINPEVSVIRFREELSEQDRMSLYRYFKTVDSL